MKKLCVIIPIYKEVIPEVEKLSIERTCQVLAQRDVFFVAPEELQTDNYKFYLQRNNVGIKRFKARYFMGIRGYNKLMLEEFFYQEFATYDYMLIAQPDAFILSNEDKMDFFMSQGYQYWGAPWNPPLKIYRFDMKGARYFGNFLKPVVCKSGNGGFSLRQIAPTIRLLKEKKVTAKFWCKNYNEDGFFSYFGHSEKIGWFNCPSADEAAAFALEADMKEMLASGKNTFAVHAWKKMLGEYCNLEKYLMPMENDLKKTENLRNNRIS